MKIINASYAENLNVNRTDRLLNNVAQKHKGLETGSGFGFGWRDIDFEFPSEALAESFVADVSENPEMYHIIRLLDG